MKSKIPKSLYTAGDIKNTKVTLVEQQNGIDPILKEPFKEPPVLDHDHTTQHVRAALNRNVNAFEGLVVNAHRRCLSWLTDKPLPDILRNLADYLEVDYSSNTYHPAWIKRCQIEFNKLPEGKKKEVLALMNQPQGSNSTERKGYFKKAILTKQFGYELTVGIIEKVK